uniref:Uncharacterized protein n=1 Tax=Leersia perrieri TaxID=77586 RepID=A0A0D9XHM6_9ORYZ
MPTSAPTIATLTRATPRRGSRYRHTDQLERRLRQKQDDSRPDDQAQPTGQPLPPPSVDAATANVSTPQSTPWHQIHAGDVQQSALTS